MPSSELREQILAKSAENIPITLIAEQLGVSRQTVYKHLSAVDNWEEYLKSKSNALNRLSLVAVERGLKRGDARLGLAWLEHTIFAPTPGDSYHIHGDVSLVNATTMVPSTASTPSLPSTAGTTSGPTEAPAKAGGSDITLSSHENFLQTLSDEQLTAELERRRIARMHTAEVVENVSK